MEKKVTLFGTEVGTASIQISGLYADILCRCTLSDNKIYRLYTICKGEKINIGVLIPEGSEFVLRKKIKRNLICSEEALFLVTDSDRNPKRDFIPICEDKPFPYISKLHKARLASENGILGIMFD